MNTRKVLWLSLLALEYGWHMPVQAQSSPDTTLAATLMVEYEQFRDTAGSSYKLEHLFRAEEAIGPSTIPGTRWSIHRELATALFDVNAYDMAFEQTRLEMKWAKETKYDVTIARAVSTLGSRFMQRGELDSARYYLSRSLEMAPKDDPYTLAGLFNNMAILHLMRREAELADRYLDTVATLLDDRVPEHADIRFSLRDNRADAALLHGDSARARELVGQNLSILRRTMSNDWDLQDRFLRYSVKLAHLWLRADRPQKAAAVMDTLRTQRAELSIGLRRSCHLQLVRLDHEMAVAVGDAGKEALAARERMVLEDSLYHAGEAEQQTAMAAVTAFGIRRMQRELAAQAALERVRVDAEEARSRFRNIILWLVVGLALASLAAVIGFYRVRVRRKQLEKQQLEAELAYKQRDLQNMAQDLTRKKQWTQEVLEAAGAITKAKPQKAEVAARVEGLKDSVRSQLRVDEQREWLYREVEVVNSAFYERLKGLHPDLTEKELELCGMVRSGLNNATIAELRHIAPTSARVAKYRLKQKLGLPEEEDLAKALAAI